MNQSWQQRQSEWKKWLNPFLLFVLVSCGAAVWAQVGTGAGGRDSKAPTATDRKSGSAKVNDSEAYNFRVPSYKDNLLRSQVFGRNAVTHNDVAAIKQVRVETYSYVGGVKRIDMIVESPACIYDMNKKTVTSPESIIARKIDGSFSIEGKGFEFRQNDTHLIISNDCRTMFQLNSKSNSAPRSNP